jgi:hypothetical protein
MEYSHNINTIDANIVFYVEFALNIINKYLVKSRLVR